VTARPPLRGSGTDLNLNSEALTRSPAGGSLPNLLIQLPGAARGANGVVHINGDHGDINYIVDGVQIPQELNRVVAASSIPRHRLRRDPARRVPAQYGERFASVININTRNGAGPPGLIGDLDLGSYADVDSTLGYHTNIGRGSLVVALRNQQSDRGLDPPNLSSPHNSFSDANQFLRFTLPTGPNFLNLTASARTKPTRSRTTSRAASRRTPTTTRPRKTCHVAAVPSSDQRPRLALVRAVVQTLAHP